MNENENLAEKQRKTQMAASDWLKGELHPTFQSTATSLDQHRLQHETL